MKKKILFFDFDGTLRIEETNEITDNTYQSFRKLKEAGHLLFLNTGRSYHALGEQVYTLPFDGVVCGCGTFIKYQDEILLEARVPKKDADRVAELLKEYNIDAYFEDHHALFVNQIHSDYMKNQIKSVEERGVHFRSWEDEDFRFVKMSLHYPSEAIKEKFEIEMYDLFEFIKRNEDETEAVLKGYSKGNAIQYLLDQMKIDRKESYAFGDGNNDEEMLLAAGVGVLIGQEAKKLVDKADFVSKSAKEDGVTYALCKLGLIKN